MIGVIVNTVVVIIGGIIGQLANKGIPKKLTDAIMLGIGLCVIYIGISGALQGENPIVLVTSIVLGAASGTALNIDGRINSLGEKLESRFAARHTESAEKPRIPITQGFVTGSLLFCVGSMAIVGSLNAGLTGDNTILFTKSVIDMISALMLAVSLGIGVVFSAAFVFVFQGGIVVLARFLQPLLSNPSMVAEMNCAGSVLIIALGLNLIGVTKIKVADYMPAIVFAPIICRITMLL